MVNEKWAGMVVERPADQGLMGIEGSFQIPEALTLSEGAPDGYNLVSIFIGLGDGGRFSLSFEKTTCLACRPHFIPRCQSKIQTHPIQKYKS